MKHTILDFELSSNQYILSQEPHRLGWLMPSKPDEPLPILLEQYREQGYLWLKGILDREAVLAFRKRYFEAFVDSGLLVDGSEPVEGLYSGRGKVGASKILTQIVQSAAYESFCLSSAIWQFYEKFLGGAVYLHKRKLIRATTYDDSCTGAHYDLTYLRAGTDRVHTSWIPIGDIPPDMGGLVYLEGSDQAGRLLEAEFSEKNTHLSPEEQISAYNKNMSETGWLTKDLPSLAERLDSRWLVADYEAGDMVIHSAYTIHASTTNMRQQMRLSTDIRYQLVNDAIDPRWKDHWAPDDNL